MASGFDSRSQADYSALFDELFPLCRSITGPGLMDSLELFQRHMPLEVESVASGTRVFDWEAPPEWRIRAARLTGPDGETVVDFADSTLHVVSYSEPVRATLPLEELQPHLHSLPGQPDLVPYVTSYYPRAGGATGASACRTAGARRWPLATTRWRSTASSRMAGCRSPGATCRATATGWCSSPAISATPAWRTTS